MVTAKVAREMITILFPKTKPENIETSLNVIMNKAHLYKITNNTALAHFLAQVRIEIGSELKAKRESLNYKHTSLPKTFKYYRLNKDEALEDGRTKTQRANQEVIANKVYANRLGNGSVATGDGYKFRGAGCIQVTGRTNFTNVQIRINRYDTNSIINIVKRQDIDTLEGALISAFGFWIWKDLNFIAADKNIETVNNITSIINKYTHSYKDRVKMFNKIKHLC